MRLKLIGNRNPRTRRVEFEVIDTDTGIRLEGITDIRLEVPNNGTPLLTITLANHDVDIEADESITVFEKANDIPF